MANLPESSTWESGIYQLETATEPVLGGTGGVSNRQSTQLGNRTKWLYDALAVLSTSVSNLLNSFTYLRNSYKQGVGTPSTPATSAFTITLNQNVNYVYINAEGIGADSHITLQAATVTNVGRRIVFNVNYGGANPLIIRKSDLSVLITDTNYYSRVIVIEYIQTGGSTYNVEVISDQELEAASNAETQSGGGSRKFVTPSGLHSHAAWQTMTILAGFSGSVSYRRDNEGIVHLKGTVTGNSITGAIGGVSLGYRILSQQTFRIIASDDNNATIIIDTNGAVISSLTGSARTVNFDGIYWFTD